MELPMAKSSRIAKDAIMAKPAITDKPSFALKVKNQGGPNKMHDYVLKMIDDYQRTVVQPARNTLYPKLG